MSSDISLDAIVVCVLSAYMFALEICKLLSRSLSYKIKRRGFKRDL